LKTEAVEVGDAIFGNSSAGREVGREGEENSICRLAFIKQLAAQ
jgi:co-chaperonin GroES (HSP10)